MSALKDLRRGNTKKRRRSSGWRRVRRRHLKANPSCAVCGSTKSLEVHHVIPFSRRPDLELEPSNLLTLCDSLAKRGLNCHHLFGHLRNWRRANPTVTFDAEVWRMKLRG
jgi:5-methylcytosine-specific restriction endonuclease McrA